MRDHFEALAALAAKADESMGPAVKKACQMVADAVLSGHNVLTFGNGGSAAQALHLAAELVVRYKDDRPALGGLCLNSDVSILTACTNDYDFSVVFSRQIEALGKPGDVAFALSTSGRSPNVLKGLATARARGLRTVLLTGSRGAAEAARWDVGLVVPSEETAHVQELSLAIIHILCRFVDAERGRTQTHPM
ncbi:MAG: SIS domain-containing protein [Acidobacteria bacterium]|nr:SIS domain-containing protein [Acidobacteriota bacterium]